MNAAQELWWRQARSDFDLFLHLRGNGWPACHALHYLQMATEKLGKAYFWRSGHAPPKTHVGFVRFWKALLDRDAELDRIAAALGFARRVDLERWVRASQPLAYALQNLAPAEAADGPNPEYPWPHSAPTACPVYHTFRVWQSLTDTGQGRKLLGVFGQVMEQFAKLA